MIILDPIPVGKTAVGKTADSSLADANSAAEFDLDTLVRMLRIKPGSSKLAEIHRLVSEAMTLARPRAVYQPAYIDRRQDHSISLDGYVFTSRVLCINLEAVHRAFPYVVTSGIELEAWSRATDDLLLRFWMEAINEQVLHQAVDWMQAHIQDHFQLPHTASMSPGSLEDWPLQEQVPLFALLGDVSGAIGVELTESLLMKPTKSVSGILFPTEVDFASCQLCPRPDCRGRRAPYDSALWETRYAAR